MRYFCYGKYMNMKKEVCYKALLSHDARFDGVFFTCVKSTGIYCRPVCPAAPPKFENCTFVSDAALAEKAGYRPCLRCRPEQAPLTHLLHSSPAHLLRQHIEKTLLMDESLTDVVKNYGASERHIRRTFIEAFGITPMEYLTTRRLLFAKQLLQETSLPILEIAYSAGFNTPGRLTVNMQKTYGFGPAEIRKQQTKDVRSSIVLHASYRPPFDWDGLLAILAGRATPAEYITDSAYHRVINGHTIRVTHDPKNHRLLVAMPFELSRNMHGIMQAVRRLFDLDANPLAIAEVLSSDPHLGPLIKRYPGVRVPGAWDNFELLIRVIVGQQISVAGATTIMSRIVDRIGSTPTSLANSTPEIIASMGMPTKRAATIHAVSKLVHNSVIDLDERDPKQFYQQLIAVPGIGPWTAEYLCMRALHWPDAFPAGDLGVQKALGLPGKKLTEKAAFAASQSWRPWRSYATMLLWRSIANQGG